LAEILYIILGFELKLFYKTQTSIQNFSVGKNSYSTITLAPAHLEEVLEARPDPAVAAVHEHGQVLRDDGRGRAVVQLKQNDGARKKMSNEKVPTILHRIRLGTSIITKK
jgi:hypothetical protein